MRITHCRVLLGFGLLCLSGGGCSETDLAARAVAQEQPASAAEVAGQQQRPADTPPEEPQPAFQPPFPDRQELFLPPKGRPSTAAVRPSSNSEVLLKGFANPGDLHALLTIDGIVTPLRAGQSRGGIRVLDISPPEVTLRRGNRQWTERLFDQP